MKKQDLKELTKKTIKELESLLEQKRKDLLSVSLAIQAGKEKNLKKAKAVRLDIAQILTIIREKQLWEEKSNKAN